MSTDETAPRGRRWPELSREERLAHFAPALDNPRISREMKRVIYEAIDHGCGWSAAIERAKQRYGGRS